MSGIKRRNRPSMYELARYGVVGVETPGHLDHAGFWLKAVVFTDVGPAIISGSKQPGEKHPIVAQMHRAQTFAANSYDPFRVVKWPNSTTPIELTELAKHLDDVAARDGVYETGPGSVLEVPEEYTRVLEIARTALANYPLQTS